MLFVVVCGFVCSFVDFVGQIRCSWTIDDAEGFETVGRLLVYGSAYIMSGSLLVGAGFCNTRQQTQFSDNPTCGRPAPHKFYALQLLLLLFFLKIKHSPIKI